MDLGELVTGATHRYAFRVAALERNGTFIGIEYQASRDAYAFSHALGRHFQVERRELELFPRDVVGLDWDVFAATLRIPEWLARYLYERVADDAQPASGGGFEFL